MRLVLASRNPNKLVELRALCGLPADFLVSAAECPGAPDPAEDAVLTRVIWLEGLEPGVNKGPGADSRERCIYLHGTNQEQKLGTPASHGCIRFSNADIVRLFDFADGADLYCLIR